jgi:acyl carrier protein
VYNRTNEGHLFNMDSIYARLTDVFHDVFGDDGLVLRPELTAQDVPEWDSLSHIRLILAVQKAFGTQFPAAQTANLKNVGELVELIRVKTTRA